MSRKREKTKEQKAELARQLGVKARELDAIGDTLRAQERVCSPTMKASLTVTKAGLGLLRRRGTLTLHLALYLVDKSGVRLVRQQLLTGTAAKFPGPALLTFGAAAEHEERIRYSRPAHFLLVVILTEGGSEAEARAHSDALKEITRLSLELSFDNAVRRLTLGDKAFAAERLEAPHAARVSLDDTPIAAPSLAASVLSLPGVHRSKEQVEIELRSPDERLCATASIDLRL